MVGDPHTRARWPVMPASPALRRAVLAALLLALALAIPAAAQAASQIASGNYPDAVVDRDGVTHVVWNTDNNGNTADVLNYCQIPLGGTGCTNARSFTPSGNSSGGNHDYSGPHVIVETNGDILLVTHRCCGTIEGRSGADTDFVYTSTDDGQSFTGPTASGTLQSGTAAVPSPIAFDASLGRILRVSAPTGGIRFQAAAVPAGANPEATYAQLSNYNSYDASVVFVGPGKFAAAWADAGGTSYFRTYTCTGNPCSNNPNNAASWAPQVAIPNAERPRLVTGANGTFLLYRDPTTNTYNTRSIDTNTNAVGAALAVGASALSGNARDITEDANGILHTLFIDSNSGLSYRASANGGQQWGDLQNIVPGPNFQLGDLKVVARTVDDGYAANAIWEDVDPGDRNPPILMQALPSLATSLFVTPPPGSGPGPGTTPGTTPPIPTPPGACQTLSFGAVDVIADVCFRRVGSAYVATGGAKINGLRIELGSGQLKLDPRARTITTSGASVTVKIGDVVLYRAPINWTLPRGSTASLGTIDVSGGGDLLGFPLKGSASVNFKNGGAEIPVHLGLPALFGGVTGDVTIRADNIAGIHLRELHVKVGDALIGPLEIKDLSFDYDADTVHWAGAATLILPPQPPGPSLESKISFTHGNLDYLQNDLTLPGPGIVLDPLGATYLKHIRFGLFTNPLRLTGGVTINAGPQIGGVAAVSVDGDLTFTLTDPAVLRADGRVSLVKIPVGSAFFELRTNGYVAFGGKLGYKDGSFEADADISGWLYKSAFNVDASAQIKLGDLGPLGGEVVFSSVGFAGCVRTTLDDFGAGYRWDGHLEFMFTGCDVGPFKAVAAAAQAGGAPRSVSFGRDAPTGVVAVQGDGAPPHVSLVGPGGVRVDAPASGALQTPGAIAFHTADTNTTYFVVKNPAAGAWQIVPQPDSSAVTGIQSADGLEQPQVTAHVRKAAGGKRELTYKVKAIPGQQVTFAEQGKQAAQTIGKAKGTEGSLRFTPADGPGGTRRIIAMVASYGKPRKNLTVASYVAPPPPKPATPKHLKATRGTKAMTITWSKAKNARRYEIRVTLSDGRVIMVRQKGTRLAIPAVATRTRATITVTGLKGDNTRGRKATLKVAAKRARRPARAKRKK